MTDHVYEQVRLSDLRKDIGKVFDRANESGEPVVATRDGVPVGLVAPLQMLRPEALPPAYFHAETRERGRAEAARYMAEHHTAQEAEAAAAWAAGDADDDRFGGGRTTAA